MAISKKRAEALWQDLRSALELTEAKIQEIVKARAWEPLGFDSFADCWADRMGDLRLSAELRAAVVFAMFDDGAEVAEVITAVAEVGPVAAKNLKVAHRKGMSAKGATTLVRQHERRPRSGQRFVRAELSQDELDSVKDAAKAADVPVDEFVRRAVLREAAVAVAGYAV